MPDLSTPSWIVADSTPGMNTGTNEAMPRFGGIVEPGQQVHISIDGNETSIAPTPEGTWTYASPELANGDHEFEMWLEDTRTSQESDKVEWENNVQADADARAWQRARNADWHSATGTGGRFIEENDRMLREARQRTPTGGGGGGGQQPMTDGPATGSGSGSGTRTPTGGGGSGSGAGQTDGPTGPTAQGLEKGNSGVAVAR